jgi:hypothetical protein
MPTVVEYRGVADVFTMRASDFAAAGFGSQAETSWSKANGYEVSVPDDVALWLLGRTDFHTPYSDTYTEAQEGYFSGAIPTLRGYVMPLTGFKNLWQSAKVHKEVLLLGDSLLQGNVGSPTPPHFTKKVRDQFAFTLPGRTVAHGFQPVWRVDASIPDQGRWVVSAGFDNPGAAAYNLGPFSGAALGAKNMVAALGANAVAGTIATWTKGSEQTNYTDGFLYYVDGPGTGAANFSYQVAGGAWVNVPLTRPATPELKRVAIALPAAASPVVVRAADSAGAGTEIPGFLGIDIRPAAATPSVIVHNCGRGGAGYATTFANVNAAGTREWWRLSSLIQPDLTVVELSNDQFTPGDAVSAQFEACLRDIITRSRVYGDVLIFGQPPQATVGATPEPQATQDWKNATIKRVVQEYQGLAGNAVGAFILADRWGRTYEEAQVPGYMGPADELHWTVAGAADAAAAVHRALRVA